MACKYCGRDIGHGTGCPAYYTGKEMEHDMFGSAKIGGPEYAAAMKKLGASDDGYLPYMKSIELAKKFQPGDPENPQKAFLKELLIEVQEKLGADPEDGTVKMFTAVGTPLDKFHGVDAFISVSSDGKEIIITMDATKRPEKLDGGWKADIMVGELPAPEDDEDGFMDGIEKMAGQIANNIKERQKDFRQTVGK